ncbi:hypothetical protein GCM10010145_48450 [Streptomyces ruber]|uniref:Lipoprotein n=2 Tax=Streptomyces TaxID=1883 RepID=A0A918EVS7_9ACTN|nr:hypothetical protein [Streptomyces ruber]GGQ73038.1 hypothetical protein GCM10010145_48450 [Streptomyces ruber]
MKRTALAALVVAALACCAGAPSPTPPGPTHRLAHVPHLTGPGFPRADPDTGQPTAPSAPTAAARGNAPCAPPPAPAAPVTAQARALARCLTAGSDRPRDRPPAPDETVVTARSLTITGLLCAPSGRADAPCRAAAVTLHDPHIIQTNNSATMCVTAPRITAGGSIRFAARRITGRVLGLLPVRFSSATVPPVPVPYITLTHARIEGLHLQADTVSAPHGRIHADDGCPP